MENKKNYQRILDEVLKKEENIGKKLLLHSCCAPCSSYVLVYLSAFFEITVLYYNPNISEEKEYRKRVEEQKRLIGLLNQKKETKYPISVIEGDYQPQAFFDIARGYEKVKEGGERCFRCYELRQRKTAELAKDGGYDFFTTTLSISPLKNAARLNEIGKKLEAEYGVAYLESDFKKKNGYLTSIQLSKEYDLYRQDYCGCIYSKMERDERVTLNNQ